MTSGMSFKILVFLSIAALAGCQSTAAPTSESGSPNSSKSLCEKAKQQGDYNTATGRTAANATCAGIYTKLSTKDSTLWFHREHTRQRGCLAATGKLCED
ncbi:hypothetical protein [Roseibium sp. Sym1]|uniref:hypothetical protein n=1 Tax=Roseibium sp. Sym1 TaxID=3016006 RepID=UPI0022B5AFD7|nr:hypothetical protein [Roseibium sp. Sym1]